MEGMSPSTKQKTDPLYFYIEFHVENPQFEVNPDDYGNFQEEMELLNELAGVLEKHGAKGTFLFRPHFPLALQKRIESAGVPNTLLQLAEAGHEIGVHEHPTLPIGQATRIVRGVCKGLQLRSITPGMIRYAGEDALRRVDEVINEGFTVVEDNWSGFGFPKRYPRTPWRPSRKSLAEHDADGAVVALDCLAGPEWLFEERQVDGSFVRQQVDVLKDSHFDKITPEIEWAAVHVIPGKVNYFGIVSHDHQFTVDFGDGEGLFHPDRINEMNEHSVIKEESVQALDDFLTNVVDPYVKIGKIKYATLSDIYGAYVEWEKRTKPGGPLVFSQHLGSVLSPGENPWESEDVFSSDTIYDLSSNSFMMWYTGFNTSSSSREYAIGYAISEDGINWRRGSDAPVITYKSSLSNYFGAASPSVFLHNDTYHVYYDSLDHAGVDGGRGGIGLAVGKDPSSLRVVEHKTIGPFGDVVVLKDPTVFVDAGGQFRMLFAGGTEDPVDDERIFTAVSTDLISWEVCREPVIRPRPGEVGVAGPDVVKIGHEYLLFFVGRTQHAGENMSKVYLARSSDGVVWRDTEEIRLEKVPGSFNELGMMHPDAAYVNGQVYLWYTGYACDKHRKIGFASSPYPV